VLEEEVSCTQSTLTDTSSAGSMQQYMVFNSKAQERYRVKVVSQAFA